MKRLFKLLVSCLILGSITVSVLGCSSLDRGLENLKQKACLHNFSKEEIVIKPTCENNGLAVKKCNSCGFSESTILQPQHVEVVLDAVAPTHISEGLTEGLACSVCGKVLLPQEKVSTIAVYSYLNFFNNPDNYIEVDAVVGESVLGNVYRIYKHDFIKTDSLCIENEHSSVVGWSRVKLSGNTEVSPVSFYTGYVGDERTAGLGLDGWITKDLNITGNLAIFDYRDHVDFCFIDLVITKTGSGVIFTLTSDTVIESFTGVCSVKRLVIKN